MAQRSFLVLQGVIGEAFKAGMVKGEVAALKLPTSLKVQYDTLKKFGMPYTGAVTQLAMSAWSMIHGMTSLFLYNYLTGFLNEGVSAFVEFEIEKMVKTIGLE